MKIIDKTILKSELQQMAVDSFGDMVKAVVDVDKELVAVDAELHSDLETVLIENGSIQINLWGINLYPEMTGNDFVEFDSLINMKPSQNNKSRGVEDEKLRTRIFDIVTRRVQI